MNKLVKRLKIIEGQVKGLQKMIEEKSYCIDVLTQATAIKKALSSLEDEILKNHLSSCVVEQMKSGHHQKAIGEIMRVYSTSKNK